MDENKTEVSEGSFNPNDPETAAGLAKLLTTLKGGPDTNPVAPEEPTKPITGADIDWSEFELPETLAHLYPMSTLHQTDDGPTFVAPIFEVKFFHCGFNPCSIHLFVK